MRKVDNYWQGPLHTAEATVNWIGYNLLCSSCIQFMYSDMYFESSRGLTTICMTTTNVVTNLNDSKCWMISGIMELGFVHSLIMSVYNYNCHPGISSCCLVSRESWGGGGVSKFILPFLRKFEHVTTPSGCCEHGAHESSLRSTYGLHGSKDSYLRGPMAPQKRLMFKDEIWSRYSCHGGKLRFPRLTLQTRWSDNIPLIGSSRRICQNTSVQVGCSP